MSLLDLCFQKSELTKTSVFAQPSVLYQRTHCAFAESTKDLQGSLRLATRQVRTFMTIGYEQSLLVIVSSLHYVSRVKLPVAFVSFSASDSQFLSIFLLHDVQ